MARGAVGFIGRETELGALLEIGVRVGRRGPPAGVVVVGDPGSGKTRLLSEACTRMSLRRQLRITGFEPARHLGTVESY